MAQPLKHPQSESAVLSSFYICINFCTAPMVEVVIGALEILDDDDDDDDDGDDDDGDDDDDDDCL